MTFRNDVNSPAPSTDGHRQSKMADGVASNMAIVSPANLQQPGVAKNFMNDSLKRRGENWSHEETSFVIQQWKESLNELRSAKRNYYIYQRIADQLKDRGFARSASEVKTKIMNMTAKYRKIKMDHLQTGENPFSLWRYYKDIREIIGDMYEVIPQPVEVSPDLPNLHGGSLPLRCEPPEVSPAPSNASTCSGQLQIIESPPPAKQVWTYDADPDSAPMASFSPEGSPRSHHHHHHHSGAKVEADGSLSSAALLSAQLSHDHLQCLREMAEEQKRCTVAVERLAASASETMKELLALHKQSFAIQSRMMDILERLVSSDRMTENRNQQNF